MYIPPLVWFVVLHVWFSYFHISPPGKHVFCWEAFELTKNLPYSNWDNKPFALAPLARGTLTSNQFHQPSGVFCKPVHLRLHYPRHHRWYPACSCRIMHGSKASPTDARGLFTIVTKFFCKIISKDNEHLNTIHIFFSQDYWSIGFGMYGGRKPTIGLQSFRTGLRAFLSEMDAAGIPAGLADASWGTPIVNGKALLFEKEICVCNSYGSTTNVATMI